MSTPVHVHQGLSAHCFAGTGLGGLRHQFTTTITTPNIREFTKIHIPIAPENAPATAYCP